MADLTLAEILTERAEAKDVSDAWLYERDVVQGRRDAIGILRSITQFGALAAWLDSDQAADALRVLIGADPAAFLDGEPALAGDVVDWLGRRRRLNRFQARNLARPLVATLEARHDALWRQQALRLLAAEDDLADMHPRIFLLAATLAAGNLASIDEVTALDEQPVETRAGIQRRLLGDYAVRRAEAVTEAWSEMRWHDRRRTSRGQLARAYDADRLLACESCGLVYPERGAATPHCDICELEGGALVEWDQRPTTTSLPGRISAILFRLSGQAQSRTTCQASGVAMPFVDRTQDGSDLLSS